jgi:hypothetical protein
VFGPYKSSICGRGNNVSYGFENRRFSKGSENLQKPTVFVAEETKFPPVRKYHIFSKISRDFLLPPSKKLTVLPYLDLILYTFMHLRFRLWG